MKIGQVSEFLRSCFEQDQRKFVIFLSGPPGIGKNDIIGQASAAAKLDQLTFPLPSCESVDLRGIPQVHEGATRWASPLPKSGRGVLLLDEMTSAAPDVQVAAHHVIQAEKGSDMNVPLEWHIVATGNRAQDATLYRAMSAPLRNRLVVIDVEPDHESWMKWAMNVQVHPSVIGFIKWRPNLLVTNDPPEAGQFPSPRSWVTISNLIGSASATIEGQLFKGAIGDGPAAEFTAFLKCYRNLPTIEAIKADPENAPLMENDPGLRYAVTTALIQDARQTGDVLMPYVGRLPAEFGLLYITGIRDHVELKGDPDVYNWVKQHKSLFKANPL